jgi:hypothetical protein
VEKQGAQVVVKFIARLESWVESDDINGPRRKRKRMSAKNKKKKCSETNHQFLLLKRAFKS